MAGEARGRRTKRGSGSAAASRRTAAFERLERRQLLNGVPTIIDPSFETPNEGTGSGAAAYQPQGAGWTFAGNSGIEANGSAWNAANAPDGVQAAFLQSLGAGQLGANGQISQSLNFTATGGYILQFQAAQRGSNNANQSIGVYLDGTLVNSFTPASASGWTTFDSSLTITTTGNHTIALAALVSSGDQSSFVDNLQLFTASQGVAPPGNPSFETPSQGTGGGAYTYNPAGATWTFSGSSGIEANGSAWNGLAAADGVQTAFVQNLGQFSQSLTFPAAGSYVLEFESAQRPNNDQTLAVDLDGTQLDTYVPPSSTTWTTYATILPITVAGSHTITFAGLNSSGDNSVFVDNVQLFRETAPSVATPAAATPDPASGTLANLSVLGSDVAGESTLSYTWAATGNPPGTVAFSANGTNAAKYTTATFSAPGTYNLQVTITNSVGLTTTSSATETVGTLAAPGPTRISALRVCKAAPCWPTATGPWPAAAATSGTRPISSTSCRRRPAAMPCSSPRSATSPIRAPGPKRASCSAPRPIRAPRSRTSS